MELLPPKESRRHSAPPPAIPKELLNVEDTRTRSAYETQPPRKHRDRLRRYESARIQSKRRRRKSSSAKVKKEEKEDNGPDNWKNYAKAYIYGENNLDQYEEKAKWSDYANLFIDNKHFLRAAEKPVPLQVKNAIICNKMSELNETLEVSEDSSKSSDTKDEEKDLSSDIFQNNKNIDDDGEHDQLRHRNIEGNCNGSEDKSLSNEESSLSENTIQENNNNPKDPPLDNGKRPETQVIDSPTSTPSIIIDDTDTDMNDVLKCESQGGDDAMVENKDPDSMREDDERKCLDELEENILEEYEKKGKKKDSKSEEVDQLIEALNIAE